MFRPVIGGAIAASVAAITVVMVFQNSDPVIQGVPSAPAVSAQAASAPAAAPTLPPPRGGQIIATSTGGDPASATQAPENGEQMQWERMSPEMRARLSGYLVNHGGYSKTNSMTGVPTDYVRIVGQQNPQPMEEK